MRFTLGRNSCYDCQIRFLNRTILKLLLKCCVSLRGFGNQKTSGGLAIQAVRQNGRRGEGDFHFLKQECDAMQDGRFVLGQARSGVHGNTGRFIEHQAGFIFIEHCEFEIRRGDVALGLLFFRIVHTHRIARLHQMCGFADDSAIEQNTPATDKGTCFHTTDSNLLFCKNAIQACTLVDGEFHAISVQQAEQARMQGFSTCLLERLVCSLPMAPLSDLLTRAVEKVVPLDLAEQKLKSGKKLRLYWGIDPTGTKIHLGHSVPLRKMRAFQDAGHHVILLIGSFTAMIGDPSGRDELRKPLTKEDVQKNFETYIEQAKMILDMGKLEIVYNHEWLEKLTFKDILSLTSNFTVQQMLHRDMFAKRMEEDAPISLTEFMYPLMVGYDSVMLDVDVELGGNDQLFNMLAGRTLQAAFKKRDKFVLTTKIIVGTDGRKMSKSYNNCVYLEDEPNDMFGKLMSVNDNLMEIYFECCTDVPMNEVKKILSGKPRDAKARLAHEIVTLYHGAGAAKKAEEAFDRVFKSKETPEDIPEVKVKKGMSIIDVLVYSKLVSSKSEARRVIEQKGVKLNGTVMDSTDTSVQDGILQVGKRKFIRLRLS